MRNRTAIRLLYVLAVLAGILPPLLFLAYSYRQSATQLGRELEFVGEGTLRRAETVLDTVGSTLRKVASITSGRIDDSTIAILRQAVFLDRYVQAIGIRDGDRLLCTSDDFFVRPEQIVAPGTLPLPPLGTVAIHPPTERGFPNKSLVVVYTFADNRAVEGLVNPLLFAEFFDHYARQAEAAEFVYYEGGLLLTSFGLSGIEPPDGVDLDGDALQHVNGSLVRVSRSSKYPIYTVTVTEGGTVTRKWTRNAVEFGLGGVLVAALLSTLVIRLARRTRSLEADLREAVRFGEIDVHYQPIMDLGTGRCIGAEALMRWHHPRRGTIPASEFIAVAERSDLILPMTEVALKKIATALGPTLREDPSLHIGVNLAPQHFASTRIVDLVREITNEQVPASQMIFEITERGLVSDEDAIARTVMTGLASLGSKLAVDDFGTGYSSLSYLQRFPLDFLKVDKAFVDGISSATESSGLVDQIIRIGNSLGMEIIAEGVEQPFQAEYLRTHGVQFAQGWFFGRPMPTEKFLDFVRTHAGEPRRAAAAVADEAGKVPVA